MKKVLAIVAIVMISVITIAFAQSSGEKKEKVQTGVVLQMNNELYIKNITDYRNANEWKYKGDLPAVIDFYADWCGPCKKVAPLMKELAKEYEGKIKIYKVNVDNEKDLASALNIESLPTILFIPMKGVPQVVIGSADKATFKQAIDQVLLGKKTK